MALLLSAPWLSLGFAASAAAEGASLSISAHKLIFDRKARSQSLHITNRGDRTGVYTMSWVDHTMSEAGQLKAWPDRSQSPWSLQPYVRFSPRRITLRPGESQRIRIALKSNRVESEAAERFSHLKILTLNSNLEATQAPSKRVKAVPNGIQIKARSAINIPVIWRKTSDRPRAKLKIESRNDTSLTLNIQRIGQASNRGFLHVLHQFKGESNAMTQVQPLVIYANIPQRTATLTFDSPIPQQGELRIYYSASRDTLEPLLGQTRLQL